MARIDVSDLLLDPDFIDTLILIHRVPTVGTNGRNTLVETPVTTVGSVQPASYKQIQRLPEALRVGDVRSFFCKLEIKTDGTTVYPDIISFQSKRFQVMSVAPWLNYGAGWCEGIAVAEVPAP